nr:cysteine synthase 1 [Quercus suber]
MIHPEGRHDGDLPSGTAAIHPVAPRDPSRHDSDPSATRRRSVQRHNGDPQCDGDPSSGGMMAILSVTATHQRQDGNDLLREAREKSSMKIGEDTSIDAVMLMVFGPRPWVRTAAMAPVRTTGAIVAATAISMAILGKCEFLNPGGSVKDRVAVKIIEEALESGKLAQGGIVTEGSAGSTAISLATVALAYGCKCHVVIPDDAAIEKPRPIS